jgi:hypothetical protein
MTLSIFFFQIFCVFFFFLFFFRLEQCVSDIVASTFVHELVDMKDDREYLSPLRAMKARCSLREHIWERQLLCSSPKDVQSSTIVLCSKYRRSLCELMVSGCEERFWGTLGKRFRDVDNKPRTMMAFDRLVLLIPSNRVRVAVEGVDRPEIDLNFC